MNVRRSSLMTSLFDAPDSRPFRVSSKVKSEVFGFFAQRDRHFHALRKLWSMNHSSRLIEIFAEVLFATDSVVAAQWETESFIEH